MESVGSLQEYLTLTLKGHDILSYKLSFDGEMRHSFMHICSTAPPAQLRLLNRTKDSLTVQILPATQIGTKSKVFHLVTVRSTRKVIATESPRINIIGLQQFINETIHVKTCVNLNFCSLSINGTFQTNVGGR